MSADASNGSLSRQLILDLLGKVENLAVHLAELRTEHRGAMTEHRRRQDAFDSRLDSMQETVDEVCEELREIKDGRTVESAQRRVWWGIGSGLWKLLSWLGAASVVGGIAAFLRWLTGEAPK